VFIDGHDDESSNNDNSIGAIGASIGGIAGAILIFVIIWCLHRHRICNREQIPATNNTNNTNQRNTVLPPSEIQEQKAHKGHDVTNNNKHQPIITHNLQVLSFVQNQTIAQPTQPYRQGGDLQNLRAAGKVLVTFLYIIIHLCIYILLKFRYLF